MATTPDKSDLIAKLAGPVLTAVVASVLGVATTQYLSKRQANEARIQLYAQLMSQREQSDSALRKDMFQTIFGSFLKGSAGSLDEQVLNLELLAYNFHESLNLKPLFIYLNKKILSSRDPKQADLLKRLGRVANDVAMKQLMVLETAGDFADLDVDLETLKQHLKQQPEGGFMLEPAQLFFGKPEMEIDATVYVLEANYRSHELRLRLEFAIPGSTQAATADNVEFSLSSFDFPMIDNTRLPGDRRVAVVLKDFDEHAAHITVVGFPGAYAGLIEKPYFQDLVNQLIENPSSAQTPVSSISQRVSPQ